jgi:hypothetical protein
LEAAKWSRLGKRATVTTSPITVAAMTGPAPKTSVTLVPDALTAVASFFLTSRRRASRWRMSASSSAASSLRASAAGSAGVIWPRSLAAWPAVISSATPPGTRSQSTACSRQAAWLQTRERSRCRFAQTFSTVA